ncbi:MAG: hypothetical protein GY795_44205 [Desulfobacterales bacterium]|nr:hypothetical protein [Desulfobacterales bacterium]
MLKKKIPTIISVIEKHIKDIRSSDSETVDSGSIIGSISKKIKQELIIAVINIMVRNRLNSASFCWNACFKENLPSESLNLFVYRLNV